MSTSGLRRPTQSEITPENILAIEAVASAMPSMKPTDIADAPSTVTRNTGRRLWIISEERSMVRLTRPSATTPPGSFMRALLLLVGRCITPSG